MQTLADIGEDALIRRMVAGLKLDHRVIMGPGDDCAVVLPPMKGERLLLKTDTVVEGVHFTADTAPRLIGRKAMARVISDFAAMAATPCHALITLIAPPETPVKRVLSIYAGLRGMAEEYGVNIVGGETSRGDQMIITVSMTGTAPAKDWVSRNGAREGDFLFVTGQLGGSIRGKHLRFRPRVKEAHWIAANMPVKAMMDLSDGLAKDLPRMAACCDVGFQVVNEAVPRTRGCTLAQALGDGEDYELLLAVSPKMNMRVRDEWRAAFPELKLTMIGEFVAKGHGQALNGGGWEHFR
jgi:thiamine-monophosphate kinase